MQTMYACILSAHASLYTHEYLVHMQDLEDHSELDPLLTQTIRKFAQ